jgi:hypothetical protein
MAAAETLELAEDRARLRALEVLGIFPSLPPTANSVEAPSSAYELQVRLMSNRNEEVFSPNRLAQAETTFTGGIPAESFANTSPDPTHRSLPEGAYPETVSVTSSQAETTVPGDLLTYAYPDTEDPEDLAVEATRVEATNQSFRHATQPDSADTARTQRNGKDTAKPRKASSEKRTAPLEAVSTGPVDLSDVIAQTTVEIKRLGWSEVQGRNHLQRTYGKRSRQQLTDEELLEFLQYLQAQPSPNESPF